MSKVRQWIVPIIDSKNRGKQKKVMIIDKNTARPPKIGTGVLCDFLEDGASVKFLMSAIFLIIGIIKPENKDAITTTDREVNIMLSTKKFKVYRFFKINLNHRDF